MFWPSVHSCCGRGGGGIKREEREIPTKWVWGGGRSSFSFGTVTEYMMPRGGGAIGGRVSRTRALLAGGDSLRSPTANSGSRSDISCVSEFRGDRRIRGSPETLAAAHRRTIEPLGIEESLKINQRISAEIGQPLILFLLLAMNLLTSMANRQN